MKKVKIAAGLMTAIVSSVAFYSVIASNPVSEWDFEKSLIPDWNDFYSTGKKTIKEEDNGNKYLSLEYVNNSQNDRKYYDLKVTDVDKEYFQIRYDVMYPDVSTEKDGDMQIKKRTGPGSKETEIVARVGKNLNNFRVHMNNGQYMKVKGLDGNVLNIEENHWYTISVYVNFETAEQSVIIMDRDTQKLLAYVDSIVTVDEHKEANMVTFTSGTEMCLDNIKINNDSFCEGYIYGSPYIASGTKNKYYMMGKNNDGSLTGIDKGETQWYLEEPYDGVTVDSSTGRLILGNNVEPGTVVLCVKRMYDEYGDREAEAKMPINIYK